jgi:hypothetical protein
MSGARFWQIVQYTNTRAGYNGYQWHFGGVGLYASADGTGANQGNASNTTASPPRGSETIENIYSGMYIFANTDAGKVITIDVGAGNTIDVLSVAYTNAVGPEWAPSQVQIRWSQDGDEWTSAKIYDDNGSTSRQVITGIEQPASDAAPANYLITRMRDRFRQKGISLGLPALTDKYRSFLVARHNRLRTLGVSLEPAVPMIRRGSLMPVWFTANDAPEPWVFSASTEYSGDYAAYFVGRFGESGGRWSNNGSGSSGSWIKIDSGELPLLVTNMLLKNYPGQGVNAFKVQGSNEDSLWVDLYEGSAADNSNFQWFSFSNDTPYRYHRLLYTSAGHGGNWTSIYTLVFWSLQETPPALVYDTFDQVLQWGVVADFSNGDLTVACLGGAWAGCPSKRPKNAGKWYWEITCNDAGDFEIGIVTPQLSATLYSYRGNSGNKIDIAGTSTAYGAAYDYPNVISVAVDFDARKIWFGKNGVWQNSGDPAAGTGAAFENIVNYPCWRPGVSLAGSQVTANFGASPFEYEPPAGFNNGWYSSG